MNMADLPEKWDLIVAGGGITGAGIFREAARMGMHVLLVERMDFAWGTSSRSSKLIHGGLRYLKEGRLLLTKASVEERERLLEEAPGLVELLGFLMPVYKDQSPGKTVLSAGLTLYDMMALEKQHKYYDAQKFSMLLPHVKKEELIGGFHFFDAQVDDARLVLRLINDAVESGASAMNYTAVTRINRDPAGDVNGVEIEDTETHLTKTLSTSAIINATGAWAEMLHPSPETNLHLRPLRGSHIVFPQWVLPVAQAVSLIHPADHRPVFVIPWEGAVLFGTTDLDYKEDISIEPAITEEETSYLMECLQEFFPSLEITVDDCISTFAGIRPVLSEGKLPPSKESREHVIWVDRGLVTVTGGKLTTFRRMAWDVLKAASPFFKSDHEPDRKIPVFSPAPEIPEEDYELPPQAWRRLYGRYGKSANELVAMASREDLSTVPGTHTLWAELPYVAKHEQVRHLSDLLLRRVRIGLLTREGGKEYLDRIRKLCESSLPWDRKRWKEETDIYFELVKRVYSLPFREIEILEQKRFLSIRKICTALKNFFNTIFSNMQRKKP
jgi:glycerol-3-phosphate dehydrogenase